MRLLSLSALICAIFLCSGTKVRAQSEWGLDLMLVKPTGDLGHLFGGSPGFRITRSSARADGFFQLRPTMGLFALLPHQDTVLSTAYVGENPFTNASDGDQFFGGYSVQRLNLYFSGGTQMLFVANSGGRWQPHAIIDFQGLIGQIEQTVNTVRVNSEDSVADYGMIGGIGTGIRCASRGRFAMNASVVRYYGFTVERLGISYWNTSLGASLSF